MRKKEVMTGGTVLGVVVADVCPCVGVFALGLVVSSFGEEFPWFFGVGTVPIIFGFGGECVERLGDRAFGCAGRGLAVAVAVVFATGLRQQL